MSGGSSSVAGGGSGSDFFHGSKRDSVLSVIAFVVLLGLIVGVASVAFGWDWILPMFLAFAVLSGLLVVRSKLLGRQPVIYEESVHVTTAAFGILSVVTLAVQAMV